MRQFANEIARMIEKALGGFRVPANRIDNQLTGDQVAPAGGSGSRGTVALSDDTPEAVGTANAGASGDASRGDHVHAHGNQAGGALHPAASTSTAGFATLAANGGTTAGTVVQANDSRMSDARTPTGAAGGALGGTYPNPTFAADMATQAELDAHAATIAGASTLGHIKVGTGLSIDGSGVLSTSGAPPTGAAGGDLSGTYPNPTVANNAITYAKIQDVSATDKLLGRATAGAGDIEEIPLTAAGRTLAGAANAAAQRTALGLGAAALLATPIPLASGGTAADLSATGGAGQVVKQASAGAALSVAALIASDIPTLTAAKISDFDTQVRTSRLDQMATAGANVSLGSHKITNLTDPTGPQDAATKAYVDAAAQGLDVKPSVRAASTTDLTLSGTPTVDGVSLLAGDRVLVKDQSAPSQNGIYVVAAGAWSRSTDTDTPAEMTVGMFTFVEEGAVNADSGWLLSSTPNTFVQFSGAGQITAGAALTKAGNTLDVNVDGSTIEIASDIVRVKNAGITYTKIQNVATSKLLGRTTAGSGVVEEIALPLSSQYGGTGVNNAGTITNAANTTITGGGTLALGGFTATIPATGTAALLERAQTFSADQKFDRSAGIKQSIDTGVTVTLDDGYSLVIADHYDITGTLDVTGDLEVV